MSDLANFDPNSVGLTSNNIFGLPFSEEEARLVLVPIPWEVTVSYRAGTARGPEQVFEAALQVDLFDPDVRDGWKQGFYMQPVDQALLATSDRLREGAEEVIAGLANGVDIDVDAALSARRIAVNDGGKFLRDRVYNNTSALLQAGKLVGLVGGDHSTPLGFIKALGYLHPDFGVLQIDAHADLRIAYEGFTYSHASIMYNVLQEVPAVSRLVQVGVRDYCDEELDMINSSNGRIRTFFDKDICEHRYAGGTWKAICEQVVAALPQKVYISFDIDGLDPKLCPNTGTPVPGGFETSEVFYLFRLLHESGRQLIGFDLNEVSSGNPATNSIDAIVGARVLFKLCNFMVAK